MNATTATGPDGRQWTIESRSSRVPPWRSVSLNPSESTESVGAMGLLIRFLIAIVIGIVFSLVVWLLELPFALLFARKRLVEARAEGKKLRWRTSAGHEQAVLDEIAAALGRGEEKPAPANAVRL